MLGHVATMGSGRPTNQMLKGGIIGRQRRGRGRTEWLQSIENDRAKVEISEWHKKTGDMKEWRSRGLPWMQC